MEDEKIIALLEGYNAGTLSEEDTIAFFQWYSEAGAEEFHRVYSQCKLAQGTIPAYPAIPDDFRLQLEQAIRDYEADQQQPRTISIFRRYRWGWAAAILILISAGGYFFYQNRQPAEIVKNQEPSSNDIAPGTTKAVLTLADGRQVIIDTAATGQLAVQGSTKVLHDNDAITYNGIQTQRPAQRLLYNTLSTNRGEQSPPLVLSDGTKVWLNALSSIRFPVTFADNERRVEITGEAYFEVAPLTAKGGKEKAPFFVDISSREGRGREGTVEVLGTHFNINSYPDEPEIRTTLLEGAVRLTLNAERGTHNAEGITLEPGQQARIQKGVISLVENPDVDQAMAWKRGLFDFNHASLQTVLRQLSRWYDIEIKFEGDIPERSFRGKITRDLNLSQVIQLLQDVNVKFRIEEKTLIVTK